MNQTEHSLKINEIRGREVLDSRGFPTVEVDLEVSFSNRGDTKAKGRAIVPSGASTGEFEALELRDHDPKRYLGKGVTQAIQNIENKIKPALLSREFSRQSILDDTLREIDGTENKSNLGANAILAVSMAFMRAHSAIYQIPTFQSVAHIMGTKKLSMPVPLMNIINGGAHADNSLQIQEFMIAPVQFETFKEALRAGVEVFHHLKKILKQKNLSTSVGDEGGFAPSFDGEQSHEKAITVIMQAISDAGYSPGKDIFIALDAASSEFSHPVKAEKGKVVYDFEGETRSSEQMCEIYQKWVDQYPIISIEDGLSEHDWTGWSRMNETLGSKCQLVGDDLFVTNPKFLKRGIDEKAANSILIKLNQIGTVTETLEAIQMARQNGYSTVISHRSGETEDTFIADLAVGTAAGQIKTGSASRTDRIAKYNQLLRIEEEHGEHIRFPGMRAFQR